MGNLNAKSRKKTFWELADAIPPILARLLACHKSDADIAKAGGLKLGRVFLLEQMTDWEDIDLPTMRRYLAGCEVDFCNDTQMHKIK
ncbi:MAG TPA: hypothetical protein VMX97_12325, partial [Hyphomicrobiaceae bacterium]|nr:hypothetical protein [Hyphomicrobiaceae bacterium]